MSKPTRSLLLCALAALAAAAHAQTVYMSGLNSPRGLFVDADGTVIVAEAGTGGGPNDPQVTVGAGLATFGLTGGVSSRKGSDPQQTLFSNLPSLATLATGEAVGPHDILRTTDGKLAVLIGMGGNTTSRASLGSTADRFGTLSIYDSGTGNWTIGTDYLAKEGADNPDGNDPLDSDPFGFAADGNGFAVADAGANATWIGSGFTPFDTRMAQNPFAPPGNLVPMQSVPTSIVARPGGGWMVGELTGFPFEPGRARLFELAADGTLQSTLELGFTNIIDLAYDSNGDLLVLEHSSDLLKGGTGDLKRLRSGGGIDTILSGLNTPTSFALSNDGFLYITSDTYAPGVGQVLQYRYAPVPEPSTFAAFGLAGLALLRRRAAKPKA